MVINKTKGVLKALYAIKALFKLKASADKYFSFTQNNQFICCSVETIVANRKKGWLAAFSPFLTLVKANFCKVHSLSLFELMTPSFLTFHHMMQL